MLVQSKTMERHTTPRGWKFAEHRTVIKTNLRLHVIFPDIASQN